MEYLLALYIFIAQKIIVLIMCKFNRPMAMLKWYFLKERSDANYKSSGFQVTGPSRLKRVLKGIN